MMTASVLLALFIYLNPPEVQPKTLDQNKIENLVNEWRGTHDYPQFIEDPRLCTYAAERAEEIKIDWSHDKFLEDSCNVGFNTCGENLAKGYTTEEQVLEAWLDSPKHRENLEKDFKYMCIECKDGYCAQQFGK